MKKLLLLLIFSCVYFGTQLTAQLTVRFGPELGGQLSNSNIVDDSLKIKGFIGPRFGGIVDIGIGEILSIQPGVFWSTMGQRLKGDDLLLGGSYDLAQKYGVLSIPIWINANFGDENKFFVGVGPDFSYVLNGYETGTIFGQDLNKEKIDLKEDEATRVFFGANFNAGFKTAMGLYIRANYNLGLTPVYKAAVAEYGKDYKFKNISLTLGWLFGTAQ